MEIINQQMPGKDSSLATLSCEDALKVTNDASPTPPPVQPRLIFDKLIQTAKIMIVDDEPLNLKVFQKHLKLAGFQHFIASADPRPVMEMILREMPDVILLDVMMPIVSGLDILRNKQQCEALAHIPTIVLTACDGDQTKLEALGLGATDFLSKPVNAAELVVRVRNVLFMKAHYDSLRFHAQELERQVQLRTAELAASRLELIHCLARTAEYRDNETGRHVIRVGLYARTIARKLGLDDRTVELIGHAAPLHDMGKIGIPDEILLKNGKLSENEFEIMRQHCAYGQHTFEPMPQDDWRAFRSHTVLGQQIMNVESSPIIAMAAKIALTHHEKWDGTGYPNGLSGEDIPLTGRITAVADVFDALSSKRPYKLAFPLEKCFTIIQEGSGTHFDPKVVEAFLSCRDEIIGIHITHSDV